MRSYYQNTRLCISSYFLTVATRTLKHSLLMILVSALLSLGCSEVSVRDTSSPPGPYDLEPLTDGLSDRFNPKCLISDLFFLNTSALTAEHLR